MKLPVKKAVIPVAGLGTRFLPITKAVPKEMLPVIDRPVIHYIVDEAVKSGIEQIIFVNGRHKSSIEDYFDIHYELQDTLERRGVEEDAQSLRDIAFSATICSVRQKIALGLGHAVLCARPFIGDEPFAVLLGDDVILPQKGELPATRQLLDAFAKTGKSQVALLQVPREEMHRYGEAQTKASSFGPQSFEISSLVEKPKLGEEKSDCAVIGRYVLTPDIWKHLEMVQAGRGGEIQLTDALCGLVAEGALMGYMFTGLRVDAGDKLGHLRLNLLEALSRPDMRQDVLGMMQDMISGTAFSLKR